MENLRIPIADEAGAVVKLRFQEFMQNYKPIEYEEHEDISIMQRLLSDYMMQIANMIGSNKSTIYVDFQHILQADHELAEAIEVEYYRFEPYLRHAVHDLVAVESPQYIFDVDKGQREFFVSFYNQPRTERIRAMTSDKVGRLISISGTVTRSSEVRPELLYANFLCMDCQTKMPSVEQQFQFTEPQVCRNPQCAKGSGGFQLELEKSAFVDWQRLRVQENADEIPPGSMPRCIDVICRNEVVEVAKAGDKVVLTGTVAVVPDTSGLARVGESTLSGKQSGRGDSQFAEGVQGVKKLGVKELTYKLLFVACAVQNTDQRTGSAVPSSLQAVMEATDAEGNEADATAHLTATEKQEIIAMRNTPHLYTQMYKSICPSVFGHEDVKRGILLMLFGGVHKKTPEGISLRGDLNVCIVGDPSCAKSQFLKYVHGFLPRTVYTSGKSSSAAGLTASVVRDSDTGEFCVEAGALMLADNGICCIDEFDKMDPNDQVAIHEAMEQQTISITKAGIQATLNARTSILAAANPVFGRYDRTKTLKANVAVSAAIMSRFDLFFVILDECDPVSDDKIARHIINVHKEGGMQKAAETVQFTREQIQKYIQFARCVNPIVTKESKKVLVECYRLLRSNDILGKNKTAYRITVRQLESLIRLSEALARLHLDEYVQPVYVREAYRLLQKSIIFVESEDIELEDNEEEMDRTGGKRSRGADDADGDDYGGNGHGGDNDNDNDNDDGRNPPGGMDDTDKAPQDSGPPSDAHTDGGIGSETKPATGGATGGPQAKKQKVKATISAEEYKNVTNLLALRLKQHEDQGQGAATDEEPYVGCLWRDLLAWYLQQIESELTTLQAFEEKKKLCNQIIRRMIKHEGNIIVIEDAGAAAGDEDNAVPNEEKMLRLHPSHPLYA